jgi:hypothetical protein
MFVQTIFFILSIVSISCSKTNNSQQAQNGPVMTITDISNLEGNSGSTSFEFNVTLDKPSSKATTVTYSTQDGTAKSGDDYTSIANQTLAFQPNETSKKITVDVVADDIEESD